jgi:hypothetical protein
MLSPLFLRTYHTRGRATPGAGRPPSVPVCRLLGFARSRTLAVHRFSSRQVSQRMSLRWTEAQGIFRTTDHRLPLLAASKFFVQLFRRVACQHRQISWPAKGLAPSRMGCLLADLQKSENAPSASRSLFGEPCSGIEIRRRSVGLNFKPLLTGFITADEKTASQKRPGFGSPGTSTRYRQVRGRRPRLLPRVGDGSTN